MKNIWCRIFGHLWSPEAAEYYHVYYCDRCGYEGLYDDPSWIHRITWRWRLWLKDKRRDWRQWWKCSDCGWHCGRHDPNDEHLPF